MGKVAHQGLCGRSLSCTCFSNPRSIDSFPRSRGARSGRPCSSRSSSRSSFHSCRSAGQPTGARAGNLAVRERRRTRLERCPAAAAEPNGEGGKREAGRVRWAVGADCCGALGCRETEGLVVVSGDRGERVLCVGCVEGWLG